nr:MAG TPA: hypothetical protein [Caudoviricetes sp.]
MRRSRTQESFVSYLYYLNFALSIINPTLR